MRKGTVGGNDSIYLNLYVPWLQTERGRTWIFGPMLAPPRFISTLDAAVNRQLKTNLWRWCVLGVVAGTAPGDGTVRKHPRGATETQHFSLLRSRRLRQSKWTMPPGEQQFGVVRALIAIGFGFTVLSLTGMF